MDDIAGCGRRCRSFRLETTTNLRLSSSDQMVDFACKVGEYRDYTDKLLPVKLMREWTSLFVTGQPLYDAAPQTNNEGDVLPSPDQVLLEDRLRCVRQRQK